MAKLLPPASTLYFPRAPILFSSPVPTRARLTGTLVRRTIWYINPSGGTAYRLPGNTNPPYPTLFTILLKTPGDWRLIFDYYVSDVPKMFLALNGNTIWSGPKTNDLVFKEFQILLQNVPGWSLLEIKGGSSSTYYAYSHYFYIEASPPGEIEIIQSTSLSTISFSGTPSAVEQASQDIQAPQPPPIRDVSNVPVKRKGGWLLP